MVPASRRPHHDLNTAKRRADAAYDLALTLAGLLIVAGFALAGCIIGKWL